MSGFRQPEQPREQIVLWSQRLEDALPTAHPVRLFDDLMRSGVFSETFAAWEREYVLVEGKPPYHPRALSALYLYGMMNRLRSSRQLEASCYNRVDVIWLMEGQQPDHATIASFVKKHSKYLKRLFRDVLRTCVRAELVPLSHISVDGTKVEGDAGKHSVHKEATIEVWLKEVDEKIAALEAEWAANETREQSLFSEQTPWIPEDRGVHKALDPLRRKRERLQQALQEIERRRQESADSKAFQAIASTTDPQARVMKDKGGRSNPNYNTQLAVDEANGVIVAAEVTDQPDDSGQLTPIIEQVSENCAKHPEAVSADSAYNTGPELASMENKDIRSYIPDSGEQSEVKIVEAHTRQALEAIRQGQKLSSAQWESLPKNNQSLFAKSAFVYDAQQDVYCCPAGQSLKVLRTSTDRKKKWGIAIRKQYGGNPACATCAHAAQCCKNPSKGRTLNRDQYEDYRERQRERMASTIGQDIYARRKHIVEPRFGMIKCVLGLRRFMRRGLNAVQTEWAMACTAVNIGILLREYHKAVETL